MEGSLGKDNVMVVVTFNRKPLSMQCEARMTMTQVRDAWHAEIGASPPVAFFTQDNRCLSDKCTISEAVLGSVTPQVLVLLAVTRSTFWLEIFGFEDTLTQFQVPATSTPATVGRQIQEALGIVTDDYRLSMDGTVLDPEQPFNAQGLVEGAKMTLDLQLTVNIDMEQPEGVERRTVSCFGSQTVGDLHQELGLENDELLVATWPYRRVLDAPLHLCHIVSDVMDLHAPMDLIAEKKTILSFEPITFPHRRQQVPVALSSTPLDLYEMLGSLFEMNTEFQLTVDGEALEKFQPLCEQNINNDTIIQLDVVRACIVEDQWADLRDVRCDDEIFLYSTDSANGLFLKDFTNDEQKLTYDGIDLTIFGSMLDVFGAVTGQHRSWLLMDRDVERSLSILSFDQVMQKRAWARTLMLDVVPISRGLCPKEVMCYGDLAAAKSSLKELCVSGDSLIAVDPLKVIVSCHKELEKEEGKEEKRKLRIQRFARGATKGDVLARMRQIKSCYDVGLKARGCPIAGEQINANLDLELYLLASESRFKTKLLVSINGKSYGCWMEPEKVCLTDVLIKVGKLAEVSPRTLFGRCLFCSGCGRKISKEEETFQTIPSDCCRVRSLQLTDRRGKGVGVQSAVPRNKDKETFTLWPEERDAATQTDNVTSSATIQCALPTGTRESQTVSDRRRALFPPPPPRTAQFVIIWNFDQRESFDLKVTFQPPLRGRLLREEIAKVRGVRAAKVEMKQKRRRRRDGAVVVVGGIWSWFDENGKKLSPDDVEGEHSHKIEDEEEVPTAGDKRTWIFVSKAAGQ